MKTIFNNSQLAHVWANQSQYCGSNTGNSMFFDGTKIWSYGSHYLMGEIHVGKDGKKYALINSYSYSNSTAKQRNYCTSALRGLMPFWYAKDPSNPISALFESEDALINDTFNHFLSKGALWPLVDYVKDSYKSYNKLCDIVGTPKQKLTFTNDLEWLYTEHRLLIEKRTAELNTPEALAKRDKLRLRRVELADIKLRVKLADRIKAFHNFEAGNVPGLSPVLIRVKGEVVETSGGASVPLRAALRLLKCIDNGTAKDGMSIGHFTYNSQEGGVVKIGCHRIDIEQARSVLQPKELES